LRVRRRAGQDIILQWNGLVCDALWCVNMDDFMSDVCANGMGFYSCGGRGGRQRRVPCMGSLARRRWQVSSKKMR
jgi:hypothetical protein